MGVEGNRGEPQGTETDGSRGKHEGRKGDPWGPGPGSRGTEGNWGRGGKDRAQLERPCTSETTRWLPEGMFWRSGGWSVRRGVSFSFELFQRSSSAHEPRPTPFVAKAV